MTDVICLLLDILDEVNYVDYAAYQPRDPSQTLNLLRDINGDSPYQMCQVVLNGTICIIDLYLPTVELL